MPGENRHLGDEPLLDELDQAIEHMNATPIWNLMPAALGAVAAALNVLANLTKRIRDLENGR